MNLQQFREYLRAEVDRIGTQSEYAEKVGISESCLCELLRGNNRPGRMVLDALGLEVSYQTKPVPPPTIAEPEKPLITMEAFAYPNDRITFLEVEDEVISHVGYMFVEMLLAIRLKDKSGFRIFNQRPQVFDDLMESDNKFRYFTDLIASGVGYVPDPFPGVWMEQAERGEPLHVPKPLYFSTPGGEADGLQDLASKVGPCTPNR